VFDKQPTQEQGAALVLPNADGEAMNLHLGEISRNVTPGAHAVVWLDGAGWHQTGGKLKVPDNISLLHLPTYSPELNPVENIWQFLRQNRLSNRSSIAMRPSTTLAVTLGTLSPPSQVASNQSRHAHGQRSMSNAVGMRRAHPPSQAGAIRRAHRTALSKAQQGDPRIGSGSATPEQSDFPGADKSKRSTSAGFTCCLR
jgi:hypothetical protein